MPVLLHTHSWYSLLEGVSSPEALLERAAGFDYPALALTDTNNLYGAVAFGELAQQYGVRPLLGACLRQQRWQCVALVAERVGYRNLCRILSRLHLKTEPRPVLTDLLAENADGLHVLVSDVVLAERLREAFGRRLWLELVRPARSARQEQELLTFGKRLGLATLASTAVHFATPTDYPTFRLVTAVRQATLVDQLPSRLSISPEHHLVDPAILRQRFRDLPEAVRNTDLLAEQLRSDVLPRDVVLPRPRVPRQLVPAGYLGLLCERGLRRRGAGNDREARQRLREELAVIEAGNLAGYFLVVRDIARYARRRGYSMALRGSAGNSLVCYLLEITDVDPLRFQLPLERFLHPGRTDLPDIDLDFDWKARDDVLAHVFRRHGPQHTAMISSHLFLQPRSAFREAGKVNGLSTEQVSRLLETLPERVDTLLEKPKAASEVNRLPPAFPLEAERWPRILADARRLLGRPHHLSIHPGGVVITPRPIEDYVPLQLAAKGIVITQFEKDAAEHIGLVKIDLLGNRALATVDEAVRLCVVKETRRKDKVTGRQGERETGRQGDRETRRQGDNAGELTGLSTAEPEQELSVSLSPCLPVSLSSCPVSLSPCLSVPEQDPATVALLQRSDTLGVNQLESPAMRHLLIQMRPTGLNDIIQALALIRPGAGSDGRKEDFIRRRLGLEPACPVHSRLEPLLRETQGLMLFEDDTLRVVQTLTGWPAHIADRFRKRVAKHRREEEGRELAIAFLEACAGQGVPRAAAAEQWVQLLPFRQYAFCKSHAVSYGLIAWKAAYLKAHHPLAFWTAALNNNQGMYPPRVYVEAVKRAGLELRLPCVNRSTGPFTIEGGALRVGLEAIASFPEEIRTAILSQREQHGPYQDLADFCRRVAPGPEALALLIRCGALDFTGQPRPALFLQTDLQNKAKGERAKGKGQRRKGKGEREEEGNGSSLFPLPFRLSPLQGEWSPPDYAVERRLRDEWEMLGFVIGPPLLSLLRPHLPAGLIGSQELADHLGKRIQVAGVVAAVRTASIAKGRTMQFVTLEDEWGLLDVTLFPGACPPMAYLSLGPYLARGIVEEQYGVVTLTAQSFQLLQQ